MTSTTSSLAIVQDGLAPEMFDIGGSRVSGTVRARISIGVNRNAYHGDEPDDIVTVGIDLRPLIVNGKEIRGSHHIQVNHPTGRLVSYHPNNYIHRTDDGKVTDAAYSTVVDIATEVARKYGTPERIHAQRIVEAQKALADAEAKVVAAQAEAKQLAKALAELESK